MKRSTDITMADSLIRHARAVFDILERTYPSATCALAHNNAFELIVATILSAQCTDQRVNKVTPALFARYPDAKALAAARVEDLEELVRSTGFFHNKAKNLIGMATQLVTNHHGRVPESMDALLTLPGVARKTANVVLGTAFAIPSGVVVDTHVRRLSGRLGLTHEHDPVKVERDLMAILPKTSWIDFSHYLIWHGRAKCTARRPLCGECPLANLCPSAEQTHIQS